MRCCQHLSKIRLKHPQPWKCNIVVTQLLSTLWSLWKYLSLMTGGCCFEKCPVFHPSLYFNPIHPPPKKRKNIKMRKCDICVSFMSTLKERKINWYHCHQYNVFIEHQAEIWNEFYWKSLSGPRHYSGKPETQANTTQNFAKRNFNYWLCY